MNAATKKLIKLLKYKNAVLESNGIVGFLAGTAEETIALLSESEHAGVVESMLKSIDANNINDARLCPFCLAYEHMQNCEGCEYAAVKGNCLLPGSWYYTNIMEAESSIESMVDIDVIFDILEGKDD